MTPDFVVSLAKDALYTVLLISGPLLGASLLVGLIISVFQATTSIQEATLTFIPKIVVVFLGVIFFGPWMLGILMQFTQNLLGNLHNFTFIR